MKPDEYHGMLNLYETKVNSLAVEAAVAAAKNDRMKLAMAAAKLAQLGEVMKAHFLHIATCMVDTQGEQDSVNLCTSRFLESHTKDIEKICPSWGKVEICETSPLN
jgi:hypothetical protein